MLSIRLHLIGLVLLMVSFAGLQAQSVYVNGSDGTETGYALKKIRSIHFDSNNLKVTKDDKSIDEYALQGLRHLTFTEETVGVDEISTSFVHSISLFPNPVRETLNVDLSSVKSGNISIFNTQGQLLQTQKTGNQSFITLEVGHLPKGTYFFHYNNLEKTETIKFVKE